jgi:hypothetical protein
LGNKQNDIRLSEELRKFIIDEHGNVYLHFSSRRNVINALGSVDTIVGLPVSDELKNPSGNQNHFVIGWDNDNGTWKLVENSNPLTPDTQVVNTFSELPLASDHTGEVWFVKQQTGIWLTGSRKQSGFYVSNGSTWVHTNDPLQYFIDNTLAFKDGDDQTKTLQFELDQISTNTNRIATWQDKNGIVAFLDDISTAITNHENLADPHPQYLQPSELPPSSISGNHSDLTLDDGTNPHGTTKTDVGLGNVDNVQQYPNSNPSGFETPAELDTRDAANRDRANHTGTQTASTISDFDTEVSNNTNVTANTAKVSADGSVTTHSDVDATTSAVLQNNFNANVPPTATDDANSGYTVGSTWVDITGDLSYTCVDATVGAAIWSAGGGGVPSNNHFATTLSSWTLDAGNIYYADAVHNFNTNDVSIEIFDDIDPDKGTVLVEDIKRIDLNTVRIFIKGNTSTLRVLVNQETAVYQGNSGRNIVTNPADGYVAQNNDIILHDVSAGSKTVNFPPVGTSNGFVITVKKTDASGNTVTNDGDGNDQVEFNDTDVLSAQGEGATYACDGGAWYVINYI